MKADQVKTAAVIGTGVMGPGIAQVLAQGGVTVRLFGRSPESSNKGLADVSRNLQSFARHGLVDPDDVAEVLHRVEPVSDLEQAVSGADFVVEAAPESRGLKRELFARLDELCPARAVLASNTSGLSITAMAQATGRPDKVVGAHFWNPAHLLPLVEVVRGEATSDETMTLTSELMARLGKSPVVVNKEVPGFVGTRLQQAMIREAFYIVEQGIATFEDVDTVVKTSFGRRLPITGPFETCDLGGLDVFLAVADSWADLCNNPDPSPILKEKVARGDLGGKTGRGLFDWSAQSLERITRLREEELIHHLKRDLALTQDLQE